MRLCGRWEDCAAALQNLAEGALSVYIRFFGLRNVPQGIDGIKNLVRLLCIPSSQPSDSDTSPRTYFALACVRAQWAYLSRASTVGLLVIDIAYFKVVIALPSLTFRLSLL